MLNFSGITTVLPNHNPNEGRVIWNNNFTNMITELQNLESTINSSNELISGGASFLSGLTYDITPLEYSISGEYYTTPSATTVTTSSGDSSYDRIDLIIVDIYSVVSILEGTPSINPVQPDINESTQLPVALITVPMGATEIIPIETIVYSDNIVTDWTGTTTSATIDLNYTGITYASSAKSIKYTLTPNTFYSIFNYNASFDTTTENTIQFRVYNTVAWTSTQRLSIKLYSTSGVQIGLVVQLYNGKYGFSGTLLNTWQTVSIPISAFAPTTSLIGKIMFQSWVQSGVNLTVILDDIRMVVGPIVPSPSSNWWNIQGDTGAVVYPSGTNSMLRISGGTNTNTIALSSNILKINLDDNIILNSVSATTYYGITSFWTGGTGTDSIVSINQGHLASGNNSFIGGGLSNSATTIYSSVVGGTLNFAAGIGSVIVGGTGNTMEALNHRSVIIGGLNNAMHNAGSSTDMFIAGSSNAIINANSNTSSIISSSNSIINKGKSSIIAGGNHYMNGANSFIGGGSYNIISGNYSFIGGGVSNSATTIYSSVVGGRLNVISGYGSFIGGGKSSLAGGAYSSIVGGQSNSATTVNSTVIGGVGNLASGAGSFIGGGGYYTFYTTFGNIASGNNSAVVGGYKNIASGPFSSVIGGKLNSATTTSSSVIGGDSNEASGLNSSIICGYDNLVSGTRSVIIGGQSLINPYNDTVMMPNIISVSGLSADTIYVTTTTVAPFNLPVLPTSFTSSTHGDVWISADNVTGTTLFNMVISGVTKSVEIS